jgi:hypothetical protein
LHYTTHSSGLASGITSPAVQGLVATREMTWGVQYSVHIPVPAHIKNSKKKKKKKGGGGFFFF